MAFTEEYRKKKYSKKFNPFVKTGLFLMAISFFVLNVMGWVIVFGSGLFFISYGFVLYKRYSIM